MFLAELLDRILITLLLSHGDPYGKKPENIDLIFHFMMKTGTVRVCIMNDETRNRPVCRGSHMRKY